MKCGDGRRDAVVADVLGDDKILAHIAKAGRQRACHGRRVKNIE